MMKFFRLHDCNYTDATESCQQSGYDSLANEPFQSLIKVRKLNFQKLNLTTRMIRYTLRKVHQSMNSLNSIRSLMSH